MKRLITCCCVLMILLTALGACSRRNVDRDGKPSTRPVAGPGYQWATDEQGENALVPAGDIAGAYSVDRDVVVALDCLVADTGPVNDRDLGPGAKGEKLGEGQQPKQADPDPLTGETYALKADNPFVSLKDPGGDASTFAIDVDTASYANVRRYLSHLSRRPPQAAVRIEECLNYFDYAYPAPNPGGIRPFAFATAVAECPWAPEHRLVRVALKGKTVGATERPPLNVVFLVDTSGSMVDTNKLPLVQMSLELLAQQLGPRDRLAIVTYAGSTGTPLPAVPGGDPRITGAIAALDADGSTNGSGGIEAAYAEALKHAAPGVQSRVVLCTDGDFNVGTTGLGELQTLIEAKRKTGVFLSVYGFGMGNYQDATLETLADKGNGVYGYIDTEQEVRKVMVDEALANLVTIAKDVKIQIFFNPSEVAGWRLIGYENRLLRRQDFNDDTVDAGDIGAGHTVTALYEVVPVGLAVPGSQPSDPNPFTSDYHDDEPGLAKSTLMQLRLRFKLPDSELSALIEEDVSAAATPMDEDFRFASAVAGFGMLLRQSPHKGTCDWDLVQKLATSSLGADARGLRAEFVGLVGLARRLP